MYRLTALRLRLLPLLLALSGPLYAFDTIDYVSCHSLDEWMFQPLFQAYGRSRDVNFRAVSVGESQAIAAVASGQAELGGACRLPLTERGYGQLEVVAEESRVVLIPLAWEPLVVVVNPRNTLRELRMDQLRDLISGERRQWNELGWAGGGEVELYLAEVQTSVDVNLRLQLFEGKAEAISPNATRVSDEHEALRAVRRSINAVAVVPYSDAAAAGLRPLTLNGADANPGGLRSGRYPLYQLLSLVVPRDYRLRPGVNGLVNFILSDKGQGYIDRKVLLPYVYGLSLLSQQGYQSSLAMQAAERAGIYRPQGE